MTRSEDTIERSRKIITAKKKTNIDSPTTIGREKIDKKMKQGHIEKANNFDENCFVSRNHGKKGQVGKNCPRLAEVERNQQEGKAQTSNMEVLILRNSQKDCGWTGR